ncbi:DUF3179 domain-containing protein [Halomicrococcus sp. SG-WS-1]|uniref:DUF3179 domain-containing protein n=1 Tax=Halomicrococcus sp. SG-WS-1 TaxID=3439057 RepID=UPI003F7A5A69
MQRCSRRAFLAASAVGGTAATAGCLGGSVRGGQDGDGTTTTETTTGSPSESATASDGEPPLADAALTVQYPFERLRSGVVSGGPPKDGIPSIDEPTFTDASAANDHLDDGDVVFGVVRGSDAKAYPQNVLVWHEICNDTLDGTPVSVTYCPLTGTAMGFDRGATTFGVSGDLLNDNLVMYDRATDSRWPQMLATAIEGRFAERSLREFRLVWTTWARWRDTHPDTRVLSEETGYVRDYDDDPYGSYNPRDGYYAGGDPLFPPLRTDDRLDGKAVVVGTRSSEGAAAFPKDALRTEKLLDGELAGTPLLAAYDPDLDTAYVYRNPDERSFAFRDGDVVGPDGTPSAPADLPLERQYAYDAMWFAWAGIYPETSVHE